MVPRLFLQSLRRLAFVAEYHFCVPHFATFCIILKTFSCCIFAPGLLGRTDPLSSFGSATPRTKAHHFL